MNKHNDKSPEDLHKVSGPEEPLKIKSLLGQKTARAAQNYLYYCSLCGALSVASNTQFDNLPRRNADDSIICVIGKVEITNYLSESKLIIIHRGNNKYEKQYTFICKNCNTLIGYQATEFDNKQIDEKKQKQLALFGKKGPKIIYFLNDALVTDPQQSSLYIEIDKIKNGKSTTRGSLNLKIKKK